MGLGSYVRSNLNQMLTPLPVAQATAEWGGEDFHRLIDQTIAKGGQSALHARVVKDAMLNSRSALSSLVERTGDFTDSVVGGAVGINDYGVKGRRQYIAERRRLLDLYVIAYNVSDIRTATTHLRNEIFRRGITWESAFDYKCTECDKEYSKDDAKRMDNRCPCRDGGRGRPASGTNLRRPDPAQKEKAEWVFHKVNYFGQSLEKLLREIEDDINIVDDGFIYLRKRFEVNDLDVARWKRNRLTNKDATPPEIKEDVIGLFRLDPTLIEFDWDARGIPGLSHHCCPRHRDELLAVPPDQGWDVEWKGECPECGLPTRPIYWKYSEQQSGAYGAASPQTLYLFEDEVIHCSRYSPSVTFGHPPILSIFEKAMTLIGMDRYLYDYFYERRVPQGVVNVVTDDVDGFKATKAEVETKMQANPHYIPWMATSSKTGQGGIQFIRFAYSLDELNYLPVRDEIRERIAGLYGVSALWMSDNSNGGGLGNETQQLIVMSRVVEGAQRMYHAEVFPQIEKALGLTDWKLFVRTPEEASELKDIEIYQARATLAQTMAAMGFGVLFDPDTMEFSYYGRVKSMDEREEEQKGMANPFGGGMPVNPNANAQAGRPPGANTGVQNPVQPPKMPNKKPDTKPSAGY